MKLVAAMRWVIPEQLCLEHLHPFAHFARNSNPVHLHVHIIVERDMRTLEYIFTLYAHLLMDYRLFGSTIVVAYKSVDVFAAIRE